MLCAILLLSLAISAKALAADANRSYTVSDNAISETIHIPFQVDIAEPCSSIQFKLELNASAENNLTYAFSPGNEIASKGAQPLPPDKGAGLFGFFSDQNAFSGSFTAGTLDITYTGNAPRTVTITEMMIIRLNAENTTFWEFVNADDFPVQTISISRESSRNYFGDGTGGGTSGGSGEENIADDDTPLSGVFPFDDVDRSDWYYGDVAYVYDNSLMNGTDSTKFSPGASLTRGMIVTILGRQVGVDQSGYPTCAFSDVDKNAYYAPYIEWGRQNEIVLGVGGNRFEPDRTVARQELAAILFRYSGFAGITLPVTRPYTQFNDESGIADYAKEAVIALYSAGVINGKPDNMFDPKGTATRAETAAMLHRFLGACAESPKRLSSGEFFAILR